MCVCFISLCCVCVCLCGCPCGFCLHTCVCVCVCVCARARAWCVVVCPCASGGAPMCASEFILSLLRLHIKASVASICRQIHISLTAYALCSHYAGWDVARLPHHAASTSGPWRKARRRPGPSRPGPAEGEPPNMWSFQWVSCIPYNLWKPVTMHIYIYTYT